MSRAMPVNMPASPQVQFADGQVHGKGRAIFAQSDHLATDADDLLLARGQVIVSGSRRARAGRARASAC